MGTGWIIFLGLVAAYFTFLVWIMRSGRMERWNLSLMLGFILMIRTQRGRGFLDSLARPRRLWNAFGDLGTVVTLVLMAFMTLAMVLVVFVAVQPRSGVVPLAANEILVIPGVNPFVPLWYGIIALIVTLVVHEGGHGVLARANNMKVKSMGLLYAIVPIGAFVEPDEAELEAARRRDRLRVFGAGPMINLVVALVTLMLFAGMVGALQPVDGVPVGQVTLDSPAAEAGLLPGDVIVGLDGEALEDWAGFQARMAGRAPGDPVLLELRGGDTRHTVLTSRWDMLGEDVKELILSDHEEGMAFCAAVLQPAPGDGTECANRLKQDAFLGIGPAVASTRQDALAAPFGGGIINPLVPLPVNFLQFHMMLPLYEVRGDQPILSVMPAVFEAPWGGQAFFITLNLLFWVFWINLMVGLTNILPMLPLDGGHIFRDAAGGFMARLRPRMDPERRDRFVGKTSVVVSLFILTAFLLSIFGPRFAAALA